MRSEQTPHRPRRAGARRRGRELALAALYRGDVLGLDGTAAVAAIQDVLALAIEEWPEADRAVPHIRKEAVEYACRIITGVYGDRDTLDEAISGIATDWPVERQSATDRNLLRMAMWELAQEQEPPAVVVSEAVAIAQDFGGPESSKFVNGVLGARMHE